MTIKDSFGNLVNGAIVTFTTLSSGSSGTFSNGLAGIMVSSNAAGVASTRFTAKTVAGSYSVQATVNSVAAAFTVTNNAGGAASVTATAGTPQSTTVGTAFGTLLQVLVKDTFGNPVKGVPVTFTAPTSSAGVTVSASSVTTDASGLASLKVTANTVAGGYSVQAHVNGVAPAPSFSLTNSPAAPTKLTASAGTTPQSTLHSTAFAISLQVVVTDKYGNAVSGRGEGSIEESPSGKFRVVISAGNDPASGKRVKITRTFDTKHEALSFRDEMLRQQRAGVAPTMGRAKVADWLRQWLEKVKPQLATHSCLAYERDVNKALIPHLGQLQLRDLSALQIEAGYAKMQQAGISAKMVRKAAVTLGVALQAAVKKRLLAHNPARDADKPRVPKEASTDLQILDPGQVGKFLAEAGADRFYALFVLWLDSGAREGELFALHWPDVDWEGVGGHNHQGP